MEKVYLDVCECGKNLPNTDLYTIHIFFLKILIELKLKLTM